MLLLRGKGKGELGGGRFGWFTGGELPDTSLILWVSSLYNI